MDNSNEQNKKKEIEELIFMRNYRGFLSWQIKINKVSRPEQIIFLEQIKNALNDVINKDIQRKEAVISAMKKKREEDKKVGVKQKNEVEGLELQTKIKK